ncbi:MAG: lysophospholipase [Polyangiaceae bacterium]|nr:lysophospholipase [Polyangiaceae bacterium]
MSTLQRDGAPSLDFEIHSPTGATVGGVVLTHGYAEHRRRYGEVTKALVARGLVVASYDLRGHGRSLGPRGHISAFSEYLDDLFALRSALRKEPAFSGVERPVLVGHSLGGLITFHALLRDEAAWRGALLSCPFFGLKLEVPAVKRWAAVAMARIVPTFGLPSGLRGVDVTHDLDKAREYDEDPENLKKATARWFTETMAAQQRALSDAHLVTVPLVVHHGAEDPIAAPDASRRVFERVGSKDKKYELLDGQRHEIWNEIERARWIALAADEVARLARAS